MFPLRWSWGPPQSLSLSLSRARLSSLADDLQLLQGFRWVLIPLIECSRYTVSKVRASGLLCMFVRQ